MVAAARLLAAASAIAVAVASPSGLPGHPGGQALAQTPASATPAIPVVLPKVQTVSDTLEITGNAAAVNQVKLLARVVGFLEQIHFEDGALVRKGDLLFTIQQDQYKAQLKQAEAQLQLQQAALLYAKTEVVRYTALLKRDAATQVDVDHWNFEQAERRSEHPGGAGAGRDRPAQPQLHRGQGAVRRPDGQASDRSGQRRRRQRAGGRARRDHTAQPDLRAGQYQHAAGAADPRQSRSAAADPGGTASDPDRGAAFRGKRVSPIAAR